MSTEVTSSNPIRRFLIHSFTLKINCKIWGYLSTMDSIPFSTTTVEHTPHDPEFMGLNPNQQQSKRLFYPTIVECPQSLPPSRSGSSCDQEGYLKRTLSCDAYDDYGSINQHSLGKKFKTSEIANASFQQKFRQFGPNTKIQSIFSLLEENGDIRLETTNKHA